MSSTLNHSPQNSNRTTHLTPHPTTTTKKQKQKKNPWYVQFVCTEKIGH